VGERRRKGNTYVERCVGEDLGVDIVEIVAQGLLIGSL
jgi:hypothetical protein